MPANIRAYVQRRYEISRLEYSYLYPSEQSWGENDREVVCFLFDMNLEKLSGSMLSSGQ